MSLTGRSISAWYKDLLQIDNSNSGVDSTLRTVKSGDGSSSSLSISDRRVKVLPSDDTTTTFSVFDKDANAKFLVDTSNDTVKVLANYANTQYAYFGATSSDTSLASANTHYAIPFTNCNGDSNGVINVGTGTNPDTSVTLNGSSVFAQQWVGKFWHVMDNMTIDRVVWWNGADASSGDTIRAHLMAYDVVSDNTSNSGNLSNGTVLADGSDITNAGWEQGYYQQMTIQSANVDAGKIILFIYRTDSVNSDYTINSTIKFHLR